MATELKKDKSYLVKSTISFQSHPFKIVVLEVTKTSYMLMYESGNNVWITKEQFDYNYTLLEDITQFTNN